VVLANGMCGSLGWVYGIEEGRHGVSVDWTMEEVEVSHSTLLSLLRLSSSLTILPPTSTSINISTSNGGYNTG